MRGATLREAVLDQLAAGPRTVEQVRAAFVRMGLSTANNTVRTICCELHREGRIERVLVRTPRTRGGICVWHRPGESPELVAGAVAAIQSDPRADTSFGGLRPPKVA